MAINNPCQTHAAYAFKTLEERIASLEESPAGAGGPHNHPISEVTGLQAALDGKAAGVHNHDAAYEPKNTNIQTHVSSTANPHSVTKAQVGLGNVDNTSDANKPISTATQTALDGKQASLGFAPVPNTRTVAGKALSADVALAKGDVGLGSVDNTSDANKPISTATQTALNAKSDSNHTHSGLAPVGGTTGQVLKKNSNTNFDYGWAADATGSSSDPWTILALSSDFTTSSATAVDVTGLAFIPAANTRYMFEAVLGIRTATATVNPRLGLAWPSGTADGVGQIDESQSATARLMANGNVAAALLSAVGGLPNTTQSWPVTVWGWVSAGASPSGNVRIQLASETAGTVVRAVAGSYLRYRTY